MSDMFGLLPLPAPAPAEGAALTDPGLDMVLEFMRAVLNSELGSAWASRAPTDSRPVSYVFNHPPQGEVFNLDETPALYAWRTDDSGAGRYSQDLDADEGGITVLWVPPALPQEDQALIEAFRNGVKKVLKSAFAQGRHPAWKIPGDTYYQPEDYGSVLLKHARFSRIRLGPFRTHQLTVESADRSFRRAFDSFLFQLETLEFMQRDLSLETPLDHAEGVTYLARPGDRENELQYITYHLEPEVLAVDPATGPAAGGTTVAITGRQFFEVPGTPVAVYFGTTAANPDLVTLDDESTITVKTPARSAGLVSVKVVFPSGVEKTLANAFTYT
jgi:hypothetical protein